MTIPLLSYQLVVSNQTNLNNVCFAMVMFVVGIFISGFFCSWLIQCYRRNRVFCFSTLFFSGGIIGLSLFNDIALFRDNTTHTLALIVTYMLCGVVFGNSKRILSCTLLIDKTESCNRTEANYTAIWIARIAVIAGPIIALVLKNLMNNFAIYIVAGSATILSMILVMSVKFPFRAPEECIHILSFDRFFLIDGWNIACVIAIMATSLGIILSSQLNIDFCISIVLGLVIAIVILRIPHIRHGHHTSTVGNTCIIIAITAMVFHNDLLDETFKPMLLGLGYGLTTSEQLYKLLDCCNHCQRSTAESTYFMSSDGGLFLGFAAGLLIKNNNNYTNYIALALFVLSAILCTLNTMIKKKKIAYHA